MTARNPRERLALTRALRTAATRLSFVRAPRSQVRAPSFRLRLHVPDLPPSPCSNGRSGTGRTVEGRTHARELHKTAVRRVGVWS